MERFEFVNIFLYIPLCLYVYAAVMYIAGEGQLLIVVPGIDLT